MCHPISLINFVIEKRNKKLSKTQTENTDQNKKSVYLGLPYAKEVSDQIAKNLGKNNVRT